MKSFLCAFNFSRKIPISKFIKAEEKLQIKSKISQNVNKNEQSDEIEKMAEQFQGTKTMKLVDKIIDEQLKKGYNMDQILQAAQKGKIINDDLKKAFQTDAVKSELVKLKSQKMEEEFKKLQQSNPDLYKFIQTNTNNQNLKKGEPQYSHAKKDKKQKQDQQIQNNTKNNNNNTNTNNKKK
ncbi:hypothetical protein TTHERM_001093749 (macronuclear) [Tetrahymena thermophila SB210]|uniref:Uncharacterized protein n=1 Tax=Tetrahymena thermophila (strain SB210) TaxID=312017 RepID=W7X1K2_TETTS|nr:hypothetical protein TTHERM_001093749 [Tetrahymena thermophila SB210]EWS71492.1 hypothetical protein TTHERM_001093749 [Tetrahymena thermophila SB210]|eukprot:XP_012655975.1 hypothetical protein TTHERM_001093749 [Tetrahymena thermophila SB210]